MNEEQLQKILDEGDEQQCVAFFKGATEAQRRALAPMCRKWFRKINSDEFIETTSGTFHRNARLPVAAAATFATSSFSELKKSGWAGRPDGDLAYEMMVDRRPPWLTEWATELLNEDYFWNYWSTIRRLAAQGLIDKPDHPNYILAMISGIVGPRGRRLDDQTVEKALREDPALLKDELWMLFECEGAGQNSLANWDRFSHSGKWGDAIVALVKSGDLPRERLLSCTLDALERDFNHYRAKWFSTLHDALKPSAKEQLGFADRYLRLLGVSAPNIASWAFKKVESLSKGKAFQSDALIAALRPVLGARQKGIVKKALALIAKTVKRSPAAAEDAATLALVALAHEEADVQAAALDVVENNANPQDEVFAAKLAELADVVAPSERQRLEQWLSAAGVTASDSATTAPSVEDVPFDSRQLEGIDTRLLELYGVNVLLANLDQHRVAPEIPAATFDGTDVSRLPDERILPITDLDELIEVWSRVIEDDSLVDDIERVLDGVSRLCDQKPNDFQQRIGPLLKRATDGLKKNMFPYIGIGADDDLSGLVYTWCTGIVLEGKETMRGRHRGSEFEIEGEMFSFFSDNLKKAIGFLSRRVLTISRNVAVGKAVQLMSTPTHPGGWIDPLDFAQRVNARANEIPETADICLALLRLAPENRGEALGKLTAIEAEWGCAVRYALGADGSRVGNTAALWIAAARCRSPWSDDEMVATAFPDHGPDAGRAASYLVACPVDAHRHNIMITSTPKPPDEDPTATIDSNCVTVVFHSQRGVGYGLGFELGGFGGKTVGSTLWSATIWPQARESFLAGGACDIADNLDWWEAQWRNKALLEPLLDSGTPLREMGLLLLAFGLAAKDPGEHGLATDVAIRAIENGRLGADNLGTVLARLLPTGVIKPARWQKRLADVARISPVHSAVIQQSLQRCFDTDVDKLPRDFAKLLDLLKELSIDLDQNISHEPCRKILGSIKGTGKAAKTAKALLALSAGDPSSSQRLAKQVLAQRLRAVEQVSAVEPRGT